jgi:hypothetical protein
MPYLWLLSGMASGSSNSRKVTGDRAARKFLSLNDNLRDSDLVPLGVALDGKNVRY